MEQASTMLQRLFRAQKMQGEGSDGQGCQPHYHPLSCHCPEKEELLPVIVLTMSEQGLQMGFH